MPDIADAPIFDYTGPTSISLSRARAFLLRQTGRVLSEIEIAEIVRALDSGAAALAADFGRAFAQFCVETNNGRFGGQVPASAKNPAGIGAINDGRSYLSFPSWSRGILAFWIHHLAWANLLRRAPLITGDAPGDLDPRVGVVGRVRAVKGATTTWRSLGGRWAVDPDVPWEDQATMPDNYGAIIARRHAEILALPGVTKGGAGAGGGGTVALTSKQATDRLIAALRARGRNVIDLRGKLPVNARTPYKQIKGGLGGITVWAQHWTGDQFTRATIETITGTDYGVDIFPANMAEQDEIDALVWYAKLHIGKDGGSWGGIAYGICVFPSGRIYVNWDLATQTYHAFDVNAYSYAVCCPGSNGQAPTAQALVSLNHVWQLLCEETPEAPAGWADLWGHTELRRFDARNQTVCPGAALLAHVQRARATSAPTVPLVMAEQPPTPDVASTALLLFGGAIDFAARGALRWEGAVDLSTPDFNGGKAEPVARYERLVCHGYNGQHYVMTDDLWDRFRRERRIVRWPSGAVVELGDGW